MNCIKYDFKVTSKKILRERFCTDIESEQSLQPINGEIVSGPTCDETKADICDLVRMLILTFASLIRYQTRKYTSVLKKFSLKMNCKEN